MLLSAPALPDPALEEIAFDGTLEQLFRYGHHDAVAVRTVICHPDITQTRHASMTTLGKKLFNPGLAAQSFFLCQCIGVLYVHSLVL